MATEVGALLGGEEIAIGSLGVVLAALAMLLTRLRHHRTWRRVWAFDIASHDSPRVIVDTRSDDSTATYRRPFSSWDATAAVAHLAPALIEARHGLVGRAARALEHPVQLSFSDDFEADMWLSTADTVVVGGPSTNVVTGSILQAFGCQPPATAEVDPQELLQLTAALRSGEVDRSSLGLGLATQGHDIFWFGERYAGNIHTTGEARPQAFSHSGYDYGVVLRLPSPSAGDVRTVTIFGSHDFGAVGAARWLTHLASGRRSGRRVRRVAARHRNIAALVRVEVTDAQIGEPDLVDVVVLPDRVEARHW